MVIDFCRQSWHVAKRNQCAFTIVKMLTPWTGWETAPAVAPKSSSAGLNSPRGSPPIPCQSRPGPSHPGSNTVACIFSDCWIQYSTAYKPCIIPILRSSSFASINVQVHSQILTPHPPPSVCCLPLSQHGVRAWRNFLEWSQAFFLKKNLGQIIK